MFGNKPLLISRSRLATTVLLLSALGPILPASAQTAVVGPRSLAAVLKKTSAGVSRFPLLVVDPQNTWVETEAVATNSEESEKATLQGIADRCGRDIIKVGSITALVPRFATELNPNPEPANLLLSLDRDGRLRALEASLTPVQWHQLGSTQGLGLSDLASEQLSLFLSLLPNPVVIKKAVTNGEGGYSYNPSETHVLTEAERTEVRLRLTLGTEVFPMPREGVASLSIRGGSTIRRAGDSFLTIDGPPDRLDKSAPYGVVLKAQVLNRPKPSQLSFDTSAMSALISFGPDVSATSPYHVMSIGDLVRRVGLATHLELYADSRISGLSVWVSGASLPAGDVLRSLCLCLTSTFRQVGPAFVLTDDVLGIGARRARIADWAQEAEAQRGHLLAAVQRSIASQYPADSLDFPVGDPLAQSAALSRRVLSGHGGNLLISDIPPQQRAFFSGYIERALEQDQPVHTDRVSIELKLRLSYILPAAGAVQDSYVEVGPISDVMARPNLDEPQLEGPNPPIALPSDWKIRALLVMPKSEREAQQVVEGAAARGLNQVWVEVIKGQEAKLLAAAIATGKERHIPVLALIRLLHQEADSADINILGEQGGTHGPRRLKASPSFQEWNRPSDLGVISLTLRRVADIVKTPGLAGIVIRDTAAPGYATLPTRTGTLFPAMLAARDLGYSVEARLAFLRQNGVDPVDLVTFNDISQGEVPAGSLALPFYPDLGPRSQVAQKWDAFRYKEGEALLKQVFTTISAAHPGLPLILGERSCTGWYAEWNKPNTGAAYIATQNVAYAVQARSQSKLTFLNTWAATENTSLHEYGQMLTSSLPRSGINTLWDGFVLDMSGVESNKMKSLLDAVAPEKTRR